LENTKCNGNNEESFKFVVFNIGNTFGYNLNTGRFAEFEFGFGFDDILQGGLFFIYVNFSLGYQSI